ncbi:MAG: hypothetical protein KC502_13895 [Myxococcales bacterium]|nr:hypothetical protein [Myxococcales bacterium]
MRHITRNWTWSLAPILVALFVLTPLVASAGIPDKPLNWSKRGFAKHSEAVEHFTLRGADSRGRWTFIRFSVANAGYRKGKLEITLLQRMNGGKGVYGKAKFKRGKYTIFKDRFGLVAGGNRLEIKDGKVHMTFALGALTGTAVLTPHGPRLKLRDRGPSGWIRRDLLTPWGSLVVNAHKKGVGPVNVTTTVFAVHEASTIKAHRTYDKSVQIHSVRGRRAHVVDYIVAPKERRHRPLGFVILRGKGTRFVGRITQEKRSAERRDKGNDYRVPWQIDVTAERGKRRAAVNVQVRRQLKRKDDLAKLGFFARKAVSFLIHPFTYTLDAQWRATVSAVGVAPAAAAAQVAVPVPLTGHGEVRYAQARE